MERLADISCFESLQNNQTVYAVQNWSLFGLFKPKKKRIADKVRVRLKELRDEIERMKTAVSESESSRNSLESPLGTTPQGSLLHSVLEGLKKACTYSSSIYSKIKYYQKNPSSFIAKNNDYSTDPNKQRYGGPDNLDDCIKAINEARKEAGSLALCLRDLAHNLKSASEFAANSSKLQKLLEEQQSLVNLLK